MLPLTERGAIYRSIAQPQRGTRARGFTQIYADIPCLIVPVSSFDTLVPYARDSTHIIWTPQWLELLKEDEVRSGRRADTLGDQLTYTYTISGRRRFKVGLQHRCYYALEKD